MRSFTRLDGVVAAALLSLRLRRTLRAAYFVIPRSLAGPGAMRCL